MEKIEELAKQSHKDRVSEFNKKLERLSEHHDIPKVFCLKILCFAYILL